VTPPDRGPGPDGGPPADLGLAAQRSWLSWQRTELSALALTGLLLKLGLSRSNPVELTAAAVMLLAAATLWTGRGARRRNERSLMPVWVLRGVSGLTVLAGGLVAFSFL